MPASPAIHSVSAALVWEVLRAARSLGHPQHLPAPWRQAEGDSSGRLPLQVLLQLLQHIEQDSGDAEIGLRLGRAIQPAAFSVLSYLVMSSSRLADALALVEQYQSLALDCGPLIISREGGEVALQWQLPEPLCRQRLLVDLILAGVASFGAWITGLEPPYSRVQLQYPEPNAPLHHTLYGVNPRFNCDATALHFSAALLDMPIVTGDTLVRSSIRQQAAQLLKNFHSRRGSLARVSQAIIDLLPLGEPSLKRVAERLAMSTRSLQRYLQAQGSHFNALLQQVRQEMAEELLRDTRLSLADIAQMLGYSAQSSFSHAYKTWTGRSPTEVRESHRHQG